jgi:KAP family P-loop domain
MLKHFRDAGPVAAGDVVAYLLRTHRDYIDEQLRDADPASSRLAGVGPRRDPEEHLATISACLDDRAVPIITGRHAILGLALNPAVGWPLVQSGVVASLLSRWRPGQGTSAEPYRLMWDVLSDGGREQAEEQPLLAAALGAPAQWSVSAPGPTRALAWSESGDRLACLIGTRVYEARADHPLQLVGEVGETAVSLGWRGDGVVALTISDEVATLVRAADGSSLGDWSPVAGGVLSGDGSHAWLASSGAVYRWAPDETPSAMTSPKLSEPASPLAADYVGRHGLLRLKNNSVLVAAVPPGSLPTARVGQDPYWPDDAAPMVGWTHPRRPPCALASVGGHGVVSAEPDGLHVDLLPRTPICRIAVDADEIGALATDASGTRLAAAVGNEIAVWSLARRVASRAVPRYDSDLAAGADLLDADRDAQAVAALVASKDLVPPLAVGLFGAWGSGKSFVLGRIAEVLQMESKPPGYLRKISVIEFNAWHYAEANLWASLVDRVLEVIAPLASPISPPEVTDATERAQQAQGAVAESEQRVRDERAALEAAKKVLARRRQRASVLFAAVLVLLAVAVVGALIGGSGRMIAVVTATTALLGSAAGLVNNALRAGQQAADLAEAGRAGVTTMGRLLGQAEALAVQAHGAELRRLEEEREAARQTAERLEGERARMIDLAASQPLGTLLHRLSNITDYRDQLSLVSRTRKHFKEIDQLIHDERARRQAEEDATEVAHEARPVADEPGLERIVVVIDDLDRCPPEKVVTVLEAVHLLFSFEMFVVLIAVDTRWLEQSLRIKYRQLLGRSDTAAPRDYLEKIIQVPLHLVSLEPNMVRTMITGLTGVAPAASEASTPAADASGPDEVGGEQPERPKTTRLLATTPRLKRPPLAAEVLQISQPEATAMAGVATLVGTTPRTVKRFVNTYRLLKARALDVDGFDDERDGIGDHEVVAFLLALVTGHPQLAAKVLPALREAPAGSTVQTVVGAEAEAPEAQLTESIAAVSAWLTRHPRYGSASAGRLAGWAEEVARFSFSAP